MVEPFGTGNNANTNNEIAKNEKIEKNIKIKDKEIKISPSILSVPMEMIADKIKRVEKNIDYIHIDVMDGKFVTNKTNGVEMFEAAKMASNKPLDVHLMVEKPLEEIERYKGAEIITFHIEATDIEKSKNDAKNLTDSVINKINSMGAKVGISIKPNTPVSTLDRYFEKIDLILIMTVEPGYGGQKLIPQTLEKINEIRKLGFKGFIEVDGGVTVENASEIKKNDVDIIVAGTAVFSSKDENEAILKLKKI